MVTFLSKKPLICLPKPIKIGNKKTILRLLQELGYHHSWGYHINNENKSIRVTVKTASKSKNTHIIVGYYNMYSGGSINVNNVTNAEELKEIILKGYHKSKFAFKK